MSTVFPNFVIITLRLSRASDCDHHVSRLIDYQSPCPVVENKQLERPLILKIDLRLFLLFTGKR